MLSIFKKFRWSPRNGLIVLNDQGEVFVRGYKQTSKRYAQLWHDVLEKAEVPAAESVLMLGLAGGGALPAIYAAYPGCAVTVVEYDPAMISIARELRSWEPHPEPKIIKGDAQEVVRTLAGQYDLIAIDLFLGMRLPDFLRTESFWRAVEQRLRPGGTAIFNCATAWHDRAAAEKVFARSRSFRVYENTYFAFKK